MRNELLESTAPAAPTRTLRRRGPVVAELSICEEGIDSVLNTGVDCRERCGVLTKFLEAVVQGPSEGYEPANAQSITSVECSLSTALACCSHGVNQRWMWPFGVWQTYLLYAQTQSKTVVHDCAVAGHGECLSPQLRSPKWGLAASCVCGCLCTPHYGPQRALFN